MIGHSSLADLARLRPFKRRRFSSWDRKGGNADAIPVAPGATATLGEAEGAGCVKHIWVTLMSLPAQPHELSTTVIRMFWDGEDTPSVEAPVGDFFGLGFGRRRNFSALPLQASPEDGKSLNCWFPMPFARGARFEVENQGEHPVIFYYYIDWEAYEGLDPELGRFHAWWNRQNPTRGVAAERGWSRADYRLDEKRPVGPGFGFARGGKGPWSEPNLDAAATTTLILETRRAPASTSGCVLNIDVFERQVNDWYGEGDDMIFVDGDSLAPAYTAPAPRTTSTPPSARPRSSAPRTTGSLSTAAIHPGRGAGRTRCIDSTWRTRSGSSARSV